MNQRLVTAVEDAQCSEAFVVTAGRERFPLARNVTAVPVPEVTELLPSVFD